MVGITTAMGISGTVMPTEFSFNAAFMHFADNDGPPGFLWKYLLAYAIAALLILLVFGGLAFAFFGRAIDQIGNDPFWIERDPLSALATTFGLIFIFTIPAILFWAMFEAAILRRYVRQTGFSIGLGPDEFRLIVIALCWMLFLIVVGVVFVIAPVAVFSVFFSNIDSGFAVGSVFMTITAFILAALAFIYPAVRLAPAAAITIRDRRVTFFGAWGATKDRFWPSFGAYLVWIVINQAASFAVQVAIAVMFGSLFLLVPDITNVDTPTEILGLLLNPFVIGAFGLTIIILYVFAAFFQYAWAGIPAAAAVTDPRWSNPSMVDVFD